MVVIFPAVTFSSRISAWLGSARRTIERLYVISCPACTLTGPAALDDPFFVATADLGAGGGACADMQES